VLIALLGEGLQYRRCEAELIKTGQQLGGGFGLGGQGIQLGHSSDE